jgi:hypothetical protein
MDGETSRSKGYLSSHKRQALLNLWVHDERFSKEDIVLSPNSVPGVKEGDLLEVYHPTSDPLTPKKVIVQIQKGSLDKELLAKQPQLQISIAQPIATQFELQTRRDVIAKRIDEASVTADFIEVVFRDQYGNL